MFSFIIYIQFKYFYYFNITSNMKPLSYELKIINLSNDNTVTHKSNFKSKKKKLFLVNNRERKEKKGRVEDENQKENDYSYLGIINLGRSIKSKYNHDTCTLNNKCSIISEESIKSPSIEKKEKDNNRETITERKTFKEIVNDIEFIHYKKEEDLKSQINNIDCIGTSNNDKNMYNPKQNTPFYQIISKNFSYFLMNNKKKNNFQLNTILNSNQRLKEEQRKSILMREGVTHIIDIYNNKKRLINPSFNYTYDKVFNNLSEKNRCEKYTQILSNLKEIILKDEKNEKKIVKEVSNYLNINK